MSKTQDTLNLKLNLDFYIAYNVSRLYQKCWRMPAFILDCFLPFICIHDFRALNDSWRRRL